jgi:hypothetical protein
VPACRSIALRKTTQNVFFLRQNSVHRSLENGEKKQIKVLEYSPVSYCYHLGPKRQSVHSSISVCVSVSPRDPNFTIKSGSKILWSKLSEWLTAYGWETRSSFRWRWFQV